MDPASVPHPSVRAAGPADPWPVPRVVGLSVARPHAEPVSTPQTSAVEWLRRPRHAQAA